MLRLEDLKSGVRITGIIPNTVVGAFAEGEIVQVLLFAVLFAFGLHMLGERGKPLVFSFGPSVLDRDIAALLIAEVAQALPKWLYEVGLESRRGVSQEPYAVHRSRQLRPRRSCRGREE